MKLRAAALMIAIAGSLPLGGCGSQAQTLKTPRVPKIVGHQLRAAEQQLFNRDLRWRIAPGTQVFSHMLPPNVGTSTDDLPVTGQAPAAGTVVKPKAVVTIITPCTRKHPCA